MKFAFKILPAILLSFVLSARADISTQKGAQETAKAGNNTASDRSMHGATDHAMLALMNLASLNIGGAVMNGLTAYGHYNNSESLDELAAKNKVNAGSLSSLGNNVGGSATTSQGPEGADATTFRRLDKAFLYQGKTNEIAGEFEKRTGMEREKFLDALAAISESKLAPDDPMVAEKAIGRFRAFVDTVPNPEFKAGLNKAIDLVPETFQKGLVAKAISKAINIMADVNDPAGVPEAQLAGEEKMAPAEGARNLAAAQPAAEAPPQTAAPSEEAKIHVAEQNLFINMDPSEAPLKEVYGLDPNAAAEDRSIFAMVTHRYRELAPNLLAIHLVSK